jgi:tetratricopeptide (TPR) repeat protein
MSRWWKRLVLAAALPALLAAQEAKQKPREQQSEEQNPPEEDESLKPTVYAFNPLQATKEMKVGGYYFKKGSYRAAAHRFEEASKWDPTLADAYFRLGEAREKLHDPKGAAEAYAKYLDAAPDAKNAAELRKKISKLKHGT